MAYEKQTWANGDIITADKLNHIESGIESASSGGGGGGGDEEIFVLHASVESSVVTFTETADEIVSAYMAGKLLVVYDEDGSVYHESYFYYDSYDDVETLQLYFDSPQLFTTKTGVSHGQIQIYWENDGTFDGSYNTESFNLPSFAKADAGKVLAVDSNGALEWKSLS